MSFTDGPALPEQSEAADGLPAGAPLRDASLRRTLALLTAEVARARVGGPTVMTRLADLLVVQTLRAWVERTRPRYLLHGHTTPDPRRRTHRLGETEVAWVRGAAVQVIARDAP